MKTESELDLHVVALDRKLTICYKKIERLRRQNEILTSRLAFLSTALTSIATFASVEIDDNERLPEPVTDLINAAVANSE